MVGFKNRKWLELQYAYGFKRILERFKMSKNLISKPIYQGNFVYMCLKSRIVSFGVESIDLWSEECTNVETTKFEKSASNKMCWICKLI